MAEKDFNYVPTEFADKYCIISDDCDTPPEDFDLVTANGYHEICETGSHFHYIGERGKYYVYRTWVSASDELHDMGNGLKLYNEKKLNNKLACDIVKKDIEKCFDNDPNLEFLDARWVYSDPSEQIEYELMFSKGLVEILMKDA